MDDGLDNIYEINNYTMVIPSNKKCSLKYFGVKSHEISKYLFTYFKYFAKIYTYVCKCLNVEMIKKIGYNVNNGHI